MNHVLRLFRLWPGQRQPEAPASLDALIRQAMVERVGREAPAPNAWLSLRQAAAASRRSRRSPLAIAGLVLSKMRLDRAAFDRQPGGPTYMPGAGSTRLHVSAYALTWRMPWGISLAACPLI